VVSLGEEQCGSGDAGGSGGVAVKSAGPATGLLCTVGSSPLKQWALVSKSLIFHPPTDHFTSGYQQGLGAGAQVPWP